VLVNEAAQVPDNVAESSSTYKAQVGTGYSYYVLAICMLVCTFNFMDRQILSILAEDIKRDLGATDADLGFLYGTAFAIFYALFGIPLGKLADMWVRTRLIALGLAFWSVLTALSGLSSNFSQLAAARIGVGIGEACAGPSAYSILGDYFPRRKRATILAIYSTGIYIGGGLSLFLGGLVVKYWSVAYPDQALAPLHLKGWQVAFLAMGLPGIILAVLVACLREPVRGLADGIVTQKETNILAKFIDELGCVIPPFTLYRLAQLGGATAIWKNLAVAGLVAICAYGLIIFTHSTGQWISLGIGVYAVASWAQGLKLRDPPSYELIWGTPAFCYAIVGFGLISFTFYSINYWAAPYVERTFGVDKSTVGFYIGGGSAFGGSLGILLGGWLGDKVKMRSASGRIWIAFIAALAPIPFVVWAFTTSSPALIYFLHPIYTIIATMWIGVGAATTQDLVLPRMRGVAGATFIVATTIIGLALGPYFTGYISHATGSLATGVLSLFAVVPITVYCLWQAKRRLPQAEATRIARARAAGEPIDVQALA
jgi:MFS family permease